MAKSHMYVKRHLRRLGLFQCKNKKMYEMTTQNDSFVNCINAKIIIVGDQGVGKTSFLKQYLDQKFYPVISPTVGVSYYSLIINTEFHATKLELWDTAGQERYRCMVPAFYRKANIALFMFDITSKFSFDNVQHWLRDLSRNLMDNKTLYYVIGNKVDLTKKREVSTKEAQEYAQSINAKYFECSATRLQGVEIIFTEVLQDIIDSDDQITTDDDNLEEFNLSIKVEKKKSKNCCGLI